MQYTKLDPVTQSQYSTFATRMHLCAPIYTYRYVLYIEIQLRLWLIYAPMDTNSRLYASPCVSFESAWYTPVHTYTHAHTRSLPCKIESAKIKGLSRITSCNSVTRRPPSPQPYPSIIRRGLIWTRVREKPICILYFLRARDVRSITRGAKKGV